MLINYYLIYLAELEETILLEYLIYMVLAISQISINIFMLVHLINDQG